MERKPKGNRKTAQDATTEAYSPLWGFVALSRPEGPSLEAHVSAIDGQRLYDLAQVVWIVKGVSRKTLWNWAKKRVTSFGLKLHTRHNPTKHQGRPYLRLLLPASDVLALREILQSVGHDKPGQFTQRERDALRAETKRRPRQNPHLTP